MPRIKTDSEVVRDKIGSESGTTGAMDYMPPAAGRYLVKNGPEEEAAESLDETALRQFISEIIRKCGDKYCLYTRGKDRRTGKRRRLGTHTSRSGAERQERAIKSHGG